MSGHAAEMHALMRELFPICRSLTGPGVRDTLAILGRDLPLTVHEVPTGTAALDWTVPDEWAIRDAHVSDMDGTRIIDFRDSNLHVVGYSEPVDAILSLDDLRPHLHSRPDLPEAIPYLTSYYRRRWGFCLSHKQLESLETRGPGPYRAVIDSTLAPGSLTYAELRIPPTEGDPDNAPEILLSTYVCHPSMANNELSGPVVTTFLARRLLEQPRRRLAYRIIFVPETLGALVYLGRHLDEMKRRTLAGYVVTCVGGPSGPTYLRTRWGDRLVDRATEHVLKFWDEPSRIVEFTERGSDERQYCAPGIDLPVGSLCRSKYHDYPEYHTSLDNLDFVTGDHLARSLALYEACLDALEGNRRFRTTVLGEPQLGRRGLYSDLGAVVGGVRREDLYLALLAYSDGETDLIRIADIHGWPVAGLIDAARTLAAHGLLEPVDDPAPF